MRPGKMIVEARINEYAMRDENPHVPWTADEIAECAARCREAGASILHFHARNPDGSPAHDAANYGEIVRKVRARCDILLHPTLGWFSNDHDPAGRVGCVESLMADPQTRVDLAPIDVGSINLESYDPVERRFANADRVYLNRTDIIATYARTFRRIGVKPVIVCWSVGFVRRLAALLEVGLVDEPAYVLVNMTDGPVLTGHPGTVDGLKAMLQFLPAGRRIEWASNVVGGDLLSLASVSAALGGHVAPGIGDFAYRALGAPPNEEIVARAVRIAKAQGREIAGVDDARQILGLG